MRFSVDNQLAPGSARDGDQQLSPKFSLIAGPWAKTEFFFNAGRGFHSNDARGATAAVDPAPGLAASRGMEIGARTEWLPGLQSSLALWKLDFDSELVYIGDAGNTEAARPSKRHGVEWNNRWAPNKWLLLDADLAWSHARFKGDDPAGNRIPNAVDKVASVAVSVKDIAGWSGSLQWRYLGSGALVEDNSVRSYSSATTNLRVSRKLWRDAELTLDVFNLFDREVYDIQYYYESQPAGLPAREDRHVHPAEPRTLRLTLKIGF
ncbi:TonB-dependent receptor [Rhizobacter sp. J219]|nr:TonB-dependent receptor [Rhizobacter sp. J219]